MIDQIRINHVLQITAAVVRQQDVDRFRRRIGLVCFDGVVYRVDDVGVRREEGICFDFLEREADAFLAKGTADFLEREQLLVRVVLHEVDVGEAALEKHVVREELEVGRKSVYFAE